MGRLQNKRGISAIVATTLIILIAVAAVTIIWGAVIPLVSNQLGKSSACLDATSQLSIVDEGITCWNLTVIDNGPFLPDTRYMDLFVQIQRDSEEFDLAGFQAVSEKGGDSRTFNDSQPFVNFVGNTGLPKPNQVRVLKVHTNNSLSSNIPLLHIPDFVSIAPMIQLGDKIVTCDLAAKIPIERCATSA